MQPLLPLPLPLPLLCSPSLSDDIITCSRSTARTAHRPPGHSCTTVARPYTRRLFCVMARHLSPLTPSRRYAIDIPGAGGRADPRGAAAPVGPRPEVITRAQIAAALDPCVALLPPAPGAGPVATATPSTSTGDAASDVATQGSADVAPLADVPEVSGQLARATRPPAHRWVRGAGGGVLGGPVDGDHNRIARR